MSTVIRVENLSKRYSLGAKETKRDNLREVMIDTFLAPFRRFRAPDGNDSGQSEDFWALKDVSFDVKEGDVVGIIGRNGAGKSTLLKVLSKITEPTSGKVKIKGRVASLLEVGTGFHPELSGRENIYLNGAILGMSRKEINRKFDEIVDFSEIEKFLDTPVKRYSSGMYVRLAFAVAAHLDPEILIIDEVLAVGDASFQKKCLGKMNDVGKNGRTVLFVSHNMTSLKTLCSRAVWLNSGQVMQIGTTSDVVSSYLQNGAQVVLEQVWDDIKTAPGNDHVRFRRIGLIPEVADREIDITMSIRMEFEIWNLVPDVNLNFSLHLYNMEGLLILNTGSKVFTATEGIVKGMCTIPGNFLNDDSYRIMIMVVQDSSRALYALHDALIFEVHDVAREGTNWLGKWAGVIRPSFEWEITNDKSGTAS